LLFPQYPLIINSFETIGIYLISILYSIPYLKEKLPLFLTSYFSVFFCFLFLEDISLADDYILLTHKHIVSPSQGVLLNIKLNYKSICNSLSPESGIFDVDALDVLLRRWSFGAKVQAMEILKRMLLRNAPPAEMREAFDLIISAQKNQEEHLQSFSSSSWTTNHHHHHHQPSQSQQQRSRFKRFSIVSLTSLFNSNFKFHKSEENGNKDENPLASSGTSTPISGVESMDSRIGIAESMFYHETCISEEDLYTYVFLPSVTENVSKSEECI